MPWQDGSLSDLSLTGEELAPGGSPGGSGSALSTRSTEALEGISGRGPKTSGCQEEVGTPRKGLGARLQQLLTPSRRSSVSRIPPPELPTDLPPAARRSPMDSLLWPRERPGSTASEVANEKGRGGLLTGRMPPKVTLRVAESSILRERSRGPADCAFSCNGRVPPLWAVSGIFQSLLLAA